MNSVNFWLALFFTVWAGSALATQAAGTGVISFSGALVEESCILDQMQDQASASCYRDGRTALSPVSLQAQQPLLAGGARTEINWLDKEHRQGILTVNYE